VLDLSLNLVSPQNTLLTFKIAKKGVCPPERIQMRKSVIGNIMERFEL
jgi:hypothetical protein